MNILVTGATGGLGRALLRRLGAEGQRVTAIARRRAAVAGVETVATELTTAPWEALLEGCATVYHLAAYVHRPAETAAERLEMAAVNHEATAALAAACRAVGARLVFASTVAVLGAGGDGLGDDAAPSPVTDYGRTKLLAEEAVRGTQGLAHAILRFPLLYGPHGRGNLERMLRAIAGHRYWPIGSPAVRKSCLHFDDAAEALLLAGRHVSAGTYLVAPSEPTTLGELHRAAYEAVGAACPRPAIPSAVARVAATAVDAAARAIGRRASLGRSIATLTSPAWYDGAPFRTITGFRPRIPLADGLTETVRWLRDEGSIR